MMRKTFYSLVNKKRTPHEDEEIYYSGGTFVNGLSTSLTKTFRKHAIILSPNSIGFKLKTHFGSAKDKIETFNESGIYAALCQHCDDVYIGQCRRAVCKRFSEHYTSYHKVHLNKSTPADHMLKNKYEFAGFRLLKEDNAPRYLDAWENIFIHKTNGHNMNIQNAQVQSSLYNLTSPMSTDDIFNA